MSLKFKCLKCGHEELEVIEVNAVMSSKVVEIDKEGYFEYHLLNCDNGCIDCYQCLKCGSVLKDENDDAITIELEVVEWLRKNCDQGDGE